MIRFLVGEYDAVIQALLCWTALVMLVVVAGGRLRRAVKRARRRLGELGERGSIMSEFVLTIMWFLFLFTGLLQIALASMAVLSVRYAAFCAARAAIVFDPDEAATDRAERIRKAAVYAMIAVSPRWSSFLATADAKDDGTRVSSALDDGEGQDGESGALTRIGHKRWYAELSTAVYLEGDTSTVGTGPVTATVQYRFSCQIPLASRVMCEATDYGRTILMTASHTLINQGAPVPLPDAPAVPTGGSP